MSVVVIDTSVWARINKQTAVAIAVAEAIDANVVAMTPSVLLELLRSARSANELQELDEEYGALHQVRLTDATLRRALAVQAALADRGYHRGPSPIDLITAAAAESVGAELWHCDKHFDLIAQLTGQVVRKLGR